MVLLDPRLVSLALCLTLTAGCGGISYRYGTGSVHTIAGAESLDAVATEALDARAEGAALRPTGDAATDRELERSLREVREAVGEHLVRAGVVERESAALPAPTSPADVDRALAAARAEGASTVVFVRFHRAGMASGCGSFAAAGIYVGLLPWLILDSIPMWQHGGLGAFEVVVASTDTGEVLARSLRVAAFEEHVSSWGCGADGVMHDMLRRALSAALEDVVAEGRAGWPHRGAMRASDAVLAPTNRLDGSRLRGLGFSLDVPAGFTVAPYDQSSGNAARLLRGADDIAITPFVNADHEPNFAAHRFDAFRSTGTLVRESETTVSGRAARRAVVSVEGREVHMLAVAAEGLGFVVACAASAAECDAALGSFRLEGEVMADGHRD